MRSTPIFYLQEVRFELNNFLEQAGDKFYGQIMRSLLQKASNCSIKNFKIVITYVSWIWSANFRQILNPSSSPSRASLGVESKKLLSLKLSEEASQIENLNQVFSSRVNHQIKRIFWEIKKPAMPKKEPKRNRFFSFKMNWNKLKMSWKCWNF